jgi:hypothetical protein
MRRVTAKPPNMLTAVSASATTASAEDQRRVGPVRGHMIAERRRHLHQRADGDDARDRVRHAHQRRVQRGRDVPDDHVADEACEHEHGEVAEERRRRERADQPEQQRARAEGDREAPAEAGSEAPPWP